MYDPIQNTIRERKFNRYLKNQERFNKLMNRKNTPVKMKQQDTNIKHLAVLNSLHIKIEKGFFNRLFVICNKCYKELYRNK